MALESQIKSAKAFLLKSSPDTKANLYDHLSDCISLVLRQQTPNAVDIIEKISETVKKEKLQANQDTIQDQLEPSDRVDLAVKQLPLFDKVEDTGGEDDEEVTVPFPDLLEVGRLFEAGGIGLGREEFLQINLALKKLTEKFPLVSARFWGKVFGTRANYIIAEAEFQEGEGEEEEEDEEDKADKDQDNDGDGATDDIDDDRSDSERDEPPKSQWKPPPTVPKEEPKTGANKMTYFVCNAPGDTWVRLPNVTPAQIVASRQIKKLFTGILDNPMVTFPPFPGKELNYLRAQIARISCTTQICPSTYFQTLEEDEEEEEEGGSGVIEPNPEFEIDKINEYGDISNWSHHIPYLLPQGRTVWWNPVQKADDEFEEAEEEEDDEEKEQPDEPEPEDGPPILTSAAEDAKVDGMPAWTARISSNVLPQYGVAIASSNLWPGAHACAHGKKFENIYIGWGLKYSARSFNPALPPAVQDEFPTGADIVETADPTAEQEKALKAAQEEAMLEEQEEEEEEEEDD